MSSNVRRTPEGHEPLPAERISLIVCTYERPAALDRLLDALVHQTRQPDEILVVDASEGHETAAVVRRHVDRGSRHARHVPVDEAHRGLTRQRNRGIAEASGSLIAFLDDDTIPEAGYFEAIEQCFERNREIAGVGAAIDGPEWRRAGSGRTPPRGWYRFDGWERRDDVRWRARQVLGLAPTIAPGRMPPAGHGRPVSFLPPSGRDYLVEYVMGGASAWRSDVFASHTFSPYFEGYGLYEDLDFCIDVARERPLMQCTSATLRHDHDPTARPPGYRYGQMVVKNGWYVWRRRWPCPSLADRIRWWLTTTLLLLARLGSVLGPERRSAAEETSGRLAGAFATIPAEFSHRYRSRYFGSASRLDP